jgi:hypothetical protein
MKTLDNLLEIGNDVEGVESDVQKGARLVIGSFGIAASIGFGSRLRESAGGG